LNDGRIQNPSNPFGIVPLSNFLPRGFGFVHHSIAILYHEVPNPDINDSQHFASQYTCPPRICMYVSRLRAASPPVTVLAPTVLALSRAPTAHWSRGPGGLWRTQLSGRMRLRVRRRGWR
jgi:hypothetical protein